LSDLVENVVEDAIEPKPGKNKASSVGVITGHFDSFKNLSSTEQHLMLFLTSAMNVS